MLSGLRRLLARDPRAAGREAGVDVPPWDVGWATAPGHRGENQDRVRTGTGWLVVCDGVGGHAGGARAATLAAEAAADALRTAEGPTPARRAVAVAHRAVRGGRVDPACHEMATTVTAARALGHGRRWVVAHVGDSPAWRVAEGRAVQVTQDHTVAGELLAEGAIGAATAAHHPGRRFVTRVAGAREGVEPDVVEVDLAGGAALVVATDGVADVLGPDAVAAVVGAAPDAAAAATALVRAAGRAGTTDDATAAVVRAGRPGGAGTGPSRAT
ncbi:protein phosphatase 2C domain-containing protein [Iamia majanohamensis]|uniref:Protein phosphatase 2C domain-containing protein n=1 Tax=Iamia majanohamensis TaxID=467976 RepID=A0AAF0BVE8_9ACTN|nr:protein phosphatase 2C domain-containing protein [Iamia majanohamensis]WCO66700.1 protein phosphatase 2C domain-containing protein [Iamia majanohamensis]